MRYARDPSFPAGNPRRSDTAQQPETRAWRGRLYYQVANFSFNSATPLARPDTMPIARFDLRTQAADTIASTSIIGFGAKSLYLQRTDDDGLQYVQRYALQ